jgi:hypothetical protein
MSSVRSRSPAPALSPILGDWFCSRFCTLRSPFGSIELVDDRLCGSRAPRVASNDPCDVIFLPAQYLGDDTLRQAGDVEACCGRPSEVIKIQISVGQPCPLFRLVEGTTESIFRPGATMAVGQDGSRPLWDTRKNGPEVIIERHHGLSAMAALVCRNDDRVGADMRPGESKKIASAESTMRCKVDRMDDLR